MSITIRNKSGKEIVYVPHISKENLISRANSFLKKYNPHKNIPVDIERITEFELGLRIFPIPRLSIETGIRSYTNYSLDTIYIDETEYYDNKYSARVTIAHEVAHTILHKDIFGKRNFSSPEEYIHYQNMLSKDEKGFSILEKQAFTFTPYILLPQKEFKDFIKKTTDSYGGINCMIPDHYIDLVESIKKKFVVSKGCIKQQISTEYPEVMKAIKLYR